MWLWPIWYRPNIRGQGHWLRGQGL